MELVRLCFLGIGLLFSFDSYAAHPKGQIIKLPVEVMAKPQEKRERIRTNKYQDKTAAEKAWKGSCINWLDQSKIKYKSWDILFIGCGVKTCTEHPGPFSCESNGKILIQEKRKPAENKRPHLKK